MTRIFATNENYMLQRRIHDANTMTHWWQEYSLQMKTICCREEYTMQIQWHTDDKNIRYKWKLYASEKNTRCKYNDTLMTRIFVTNEDYMIVVGIHDANIMKYWWEQIFVTNGNYMLQVRIHDANTMTRCRQKNKNITCATPEEV